MNQWEPVKLEPVFKETVWGGSRLASVFGKEIPSVHTGESWEVAAHQHGQSRLVNGALAGKTLQEAIDLYPEAILGTEVYQKHGTHFPILIKFIDAADKLSVQVHPDDALAHQLEGPEENGKTEMWVVLDADPGAKLVYVFNRDTTKEELKTAIAQQQLEELLCYVPVKKGDVFFIPAGTVHAIGEGILIAEIQQNSDTTYRVYDYGRIGLDGQPRALHVDKALTAAHLQAKPAADIDLTKGICCPYFAVRRQTLNGVAELPVHKEHFEILMILEGSMTIGGLTVKKGDSVLVPAAAGSQRLEGQAEYLQIQ